MAISQQANDVIRRTDTARIYDLRGELSSLADDVGVDVLDERTPPRLTVELDVANITDPVVDLLEEYTASIEPDSVEVTAQGGLAFDVTCPEGFRAVGTRNMREYGKSSVTITFTSQSIQVSGMDIGTGVELYARDGAILLTESERDPESTGE